LYIGGGRQHDLYGIHGCQTIDEIQKELYHHSFNKPYKSSLTEEQLDNRIVDTIYWDTFRQIQRQSKLFPNMFKLGSPLNPHKAYLFMMRTNLIEGTPQAVNNITPSVASGGWEDVHTVHHSQEGEPTQAVLFPIQETTAPHIPPVASQPPITTNDDLPVPTQTITNTTEPPIPPVV
jgi:hypothetical protein